MRVQQSFKCLTFVNNGDISTSLLEGKLREQFKYKPDSYSEMQSFSRETKLPY